MIQILNPETILNCIDEYINMGYKIGTIVSFTAPTKNAILKGQIVLKKPASKMFEDYGSKNIGYTSDEMIYSVRVFGIIRKNKDSYEKPKLCKIPEENIKGVLKTAEKGRKLDVTTF